VVLRLELPDLGEISNLFLHEFRIGSMSEQGN